MRDRTKVQQLMPLMREFGGLERKRLGEGITPLEYQRWLDLKGRIGKSFAKSRQAGLQAMGGRDGKERPTRMLVEYRNREHLLDSIVSNIKILKPSRAQGSGISKLFASMLDHELGLAG
jgi:hypothetical protein